MCGESFSPEVAAITGRIGGLGMTLAILCRKAGPVGSGEAAFQPPGFRGVGVMHADRRGAAAVFRPLCR